MLHYIEVPGEQRADDREVTIYLWGFGREARDYSYISDFSGGESLPANRYHLIPKT